MVYNSFLYLSWGLFAFSVVQLLAYTFRNVPEFRVGTGLVIGLIFLFILAAGVFNGIGLKIADKGSLAIGLIPSCIILAFVTLAIIAGVTI